jgi:hypothetical protein
VHEQDGGDVTAADLDGRHPVLRSVHRPRAGLPALLVATTVVVLAQVPPGVPSAAGEVSKAVTGGRTASTAGTTALPPGWSVRPGPEGRVLVWAPGRQLPFGGARIEVVAGDRSLGAARVAADLRSLEVPLPSGLDAPGDLAGLPVAASTRGRRHFPGSRTPRSTSRARAARPGRRSPRPRPRAPPPL